METRTNYISGILGSIRDWLSEYARNVIIATIITVILFGLFAVPAMVTWDREETVYGFTNDVTIPQNANGTIETWTVISREAVGHRSSTSYEVVLGGPNGEREMVSVSRDEYASADEGRQIEVASYTLSASYGWRVLTFVEWFIVGAIALAAIAFIVLVIRAEVF